MITQQITQAEQVHGNRKHLTPNIDVPILPLPAFPLDTKQNVLQGQVPRFTSRFFTYIILDFLFSKRIRQASHTVDVKMIVSLVLRRPFWETIIMSLLWKFICSACVAFPCVLVSSTTKNIASGPEILWLQNSEIKGWRKWRKEKKKNHHPLGRPTNYNKVVIIFNNVYMFLPSHNMLLTHQRQTPLLCLHLNVAHFYWGKLGLGPLKRPLL